MKKYLFIVSLLILFTSVLYAAVVGTCPYYCSDNGSERCKKTWEGGTYGGCTGPETCTTCTYGCSDNICNSASSCSEVNEDCFSNLCCSGLQCSGGPHFVCVSPTPTPTPIPNCEDTSTNYNYKCIPSGQTCDDWDCRESSAREGTCPTQGETCCFKNKNSNPNTCRAPTPNPNDGSETPNPTGVTAPSFTPDANDITITLTTGTNRFSLPSKNLKHSTCNNVIIDDYNTVSKSYNKERNVNLDSNKIQSLESGKGYFITTNSECELIFDNKEGFTRTIPKGSNLLPSNIKFEQTCKFGKIFFQLSIFYEAFELSYDTQNGLVLDNEENTAYWVYSNVDNCEIRRD